VASRGGQTEDRADQRLDLNRLGNMACHARLPGQFPLAGRHAGRHGDDRHCLPARIATDGAGGRQAVHDGHLDVHQDAIKPLAGQALQGDLAVLGHAHPRAV
jgi:hypothetical protein